MPDPSTFDVLLRRRRLAAGLTQEELARAAKVGVRTVRNLETRRAVRPQRSTVDLLADALGLTGGARDQFAAAARAARAQPGAVGPRQEEPLRGGLEHERLAATERQSAPFTAYVRLNHS